MFRVASQMPPLHHFPVDGSSFEISKSEVARWLCAQAEIQQTIFNIAKRHAMITYDVESRTWRGVRWHTEP